MTKVPDLFNNRNGFNTRVSTYHMAETTIPVSTDTHEAVRSKKRGGETFDTLISRVFEEYQPDE
jgi:hypothetical protein